MTRELLFPPDFDDYAWEVESKGVFWGAAVRIDDWLIGVTFYEPTRLQQDIDAEWEGGTLFIVKRLLVVERVTIENMRSAVREAPSDFFA
jgi:hypothetical protein